MIEKKPFKIDFGEPVNVYRIHCLSRSDDNNICKENELMFFGDIEWKSSTRKSLLGVVYRLRAILERQGGYFTYIEKCWCFIL